MKQQHRDHRKLADRSKERQDEARRNRQQYKSWRDVLKEGQWLWCPGGCGQEIFVKGAAKGKTCSICGTPLTM